MLHRFRFFRMTNRPTHINPNSLKKNVVAVILRWHKRSPLILKPYHEFYQ